MNEIEPKHEQVEFFPKIEPKKIVIDLDDAPELAELLKQIGTRKINRFTKSEVSGTNAISGERDNPRKSLRRGFPEE